MTDAEHAAVLRGMDDTPEINLTPTEWAAIERAIELLDQQHRIDTWEPKATRTRRDDAFTFVAERTGER